MEIRSATLMIEAFMAQHLDSSWKFKLDNARTRGGECDYNTKTISMSRHLIPLWSEEEVRETILHEIGHALVSPHVKERHGSIWQNKVRSIGGNPTRCHDNAVIQGRYMLICPNGHTTYKHRRPSKPRSCAKCSPVFDTRYLFKVIDTK